MATAKSSIDELTKAMNKEQLAAKKAAMKAKKEATKASVNKLKEAIKELKGYAFSLKEDDAVSRKGTLVIDNGSPESPESYSIKVKI